MLAVVPELSIAVMTHPSRIEPLERVLQDLADEGLDADVVVDPDPDGPRSPWRTAQAAWASTPESCTHRLVLQDDALICHGFAPAVEAALDAQPDHPVSFFVNWLGYQLGRAQVEACGRLDSWCWLPSYAWYPTVALALPRLMALDLAAYPVRRKAAADDLVTAAWAHERGHRVLQTMPSLVQHDESAPSTMEKSSRARQRHAVCFVGDHPNASLIDWTRGP